MPYSTRLTPEKEPIQQKPGTINKLPIGVTEVTNTPPSNPVLGNTFTVNPTGGPVMPVNTVNNPNATQSSSNSGTLTSNVNNPNITKTNTNSGTLISNVNNPNATQSSTNNGTLTNSVNNLPVQGTGNFDKPYIPTPVIPGSCYA